MYNKYKNSKKIAKSRQSNAYMPTGFERKRGRWVLSRTRRQMDESVELRVDKDTIQLPKRDPKIPQ